MNTTRLGVIVLNTLGVTGAIVTIYTAPEKLRVYIVIGLLLTLPIIIFFEVIFFFRTRPTQPAIPVGDVRVLRAGYVVRTATEHDIVWIANLEQKWFHQDAVPKDRLIEWHKANPNAFFVIEDKAGDKVGHMDILPIRPGTLNQFLDGQITEKEILGDCLYTPSEKGAVKALYVESLIIDVPNIHHRGLALHSLLLEFNRLISEVSDPNNIETLYAMAATSQGARIISEFGFSVVKNAKERPDHHDVYAVKFATLKENIAKL